MIAAFALSVSLAQAPTRDLPVSLLPKGREFILKSGSKQDRVPIQSAEYPLLPKTNWPPERVLFRKDGAYAVWDSRGLSVRQGAWVFTTQLPEIPLSPKLFEREEIVKNRLLIEGGARKAAASGLSGALRDGSRVYFLANWQDKSGKIWLEALVAVDLNEEKPKPKLLGRFEGLSVDLSPGESRLFIREGKPSAWIQSTDAWGLGQFDSETTGFPFEIVGERPERIEKQSGRIGWFVGRTDFGSRILYRWDSVNLNRRELAETRGTIRLMDVATPWIAVVHEDEGAFLQNLETGGRTRLPETPGFRRTAFGVLVWTPASKPSKAVLYETSRWDVLGRWP